MISAVYSSTQRWDLMNEAAIYRRVAPAAGNTRLGRNRENVALHLREQRIADANVQFLDLSKAQSIHVGPANRGDAIRRKEMRR